jgi:hypothetical protein
VVHLSLNAGGSKAAFLIVPQQHSLVLLSTLQIHFFYSALYFRSSVEWEASEATKSVAILFTVPTLIAKRSASLSARIF